MMPALARVLVAVVVVGALLVALAWAGQRRMIYFPDRAAPLLPEGLLPGVRQVTFGTEDGLRLAAWYVPATRGPEDAPLILIAHGNAGNRASRTPLAAALAANGMDVFLMDYRGYGGNPGSPSEKGLDRDIRAAHRFVRDELEVPQERLLYYGESLGTGVVTGLAATDPPAGLILRSPFTDLPAVGQVHYPYLPVRALLRDRFPVAERLATIHVATTVIYGTADRTVPPEQSREVARRAGGTVREIEIQGADHNDRALLDGPELIAAVTALATATRDDTVE